MNEVLSCEENNIFPYFVDATKYGNTPELMDGTLEINIKNKKDKTDSIFALDEHFKGEVVSCKISSLMKFYQETGEKVLLNNNVRYKLKRSTVNKEIEKSFLDDPSK